MVAGRLFLTGPDESARLLGMDMKAPPTSASPASAPSELIAVMSIARLRRGY